MLLVDFVDRYIDSRPLSDSYAENLRKRADKLVAFSGRSELSAVFNESTLNGFLASLAELSPYTKNKYRADYLALWRSAADEDLVPYPMSRRIRREKSPQRVVECYLLHEVRALVVAAEHLGGAYPNGVARRHYWPAIIRAAWDSGLRRGDLWRLKLSEIRKDGSALIVQHKTGIVQPCRFYPSTRQAMKLAGGALEWPLCAWCFGEHFWEVARLSSIERGTFKWLRRGSGSNVEAEHGNGHKHLGNGRAVFEKHYDAKLDARNRPMPPEI
jgi:integrase